MSETRKTSYEEGQRQRLRRRARNERIMAGFSRPHARTRPRDPITAQRLREIGTPEELIDPVIGESPRPVS